MKRLFLGLIAASVLGGCFVGTSSNSGSGTDYNPAPAYTAPSVARSSTLVVGQMKASLSAQSDGQTVKIYAGAFYEGQAVVLEGGDYFSAQLPGADAIVLTREQGTKDDVVHYAGTFPEQIAAVDVIIALNRPTGKTSAPASKIHLPAPFQLTTTASPTTHRGTSLAFQVTPAPLFELMQLTIDADPTCLDTKASTVFEAIGIGSDGMASFDTLNLTLRGGSCPISVNLRRQTNGEIDPAFAGGVGGLLDDAEGLQVRSFATTLIP